MKSIGLVGCGVIGQTILRAVEAGTLDAPVAGVMSVPEDEARVFLATLRNPPPFLSLPELVARSDMVVEVAQQSVVPEVARQTFDAGKDLMVISVGALLDHPEIIGRAKEAGCRLMVPSGAIAGLDGIKSASIGQISHVTMTTRKPPQGLEGAPYLVERGISLVGLEEEREVFSGSAREGCRGFPANVNVAAAVSLAGIGPDETKMRILAVPGLERNCHDVEVEGEFGRLTVHIENIPTENPKTGRIAAMSVIRTLQEAVGSVRIGT